MNKSDKISFATNTTTKEALYYVMLYTWVIIRNIGKEINHAVHKLPWVFIVAIVAISVFVSYIQIGKARAERDSYNKKMVQMSMQLDNYKVLYGDGYKK